MFFKPQRNYDWSSISTITGWSSSSSSISKSQSNFCVRWAWNFSAFWRRSESMAEELDRILEKKLVRTVTRKLLLETMSTKKSSGTSLIWKSSGCVKLFFSEIIVIKLPGNANQLWELCKVWDIWLKLRRKCIKWSKVFSNARKSRSVGQPENIQTRIVAQQVPHQF